MSTAIRICLTILAPFALAVCGSDGRRGNQTTEPPVTTEPPPPPAPPGQRGAIAYVRGKAEIRVIQPDGSGDRLLWAHPEPQNAKTQGITSLAWRPDGGELAFSSGHESAFSLFEADIYAIRPNGSGLRRVTNAPARAALASLPKGTVTVTIRNDPLNSGYTQASGLFGIYLAGAPDGQIVTIPPGSSTTVTFTNVADLGSGPQAIVAINPPWRWFYPGVDVRATASVTAPTFLITGGGSRNFGAYGPAWRSDGSRIGYLNGCAFLASIRADATAGSGTGEIMGGVEQATGACAFDWGPASAADQLLHAGGVSDRGSIYRVSERGTGRAQLLEATDSSVFDVRWLPDGSGFVYGLVNQFQSNSNLFHYDLTTKRVTQLTQFTSEFVRSFAVSPDGRFVVFERAEKLFQFDFETPVRPDLWVIGVDGSNPRLLVENGETPAW